MCRTEVYIFIGLVIAAVVVRVLLAILESIPQHDDSKAIATHVELKPPSMQNHSTGSATLDGQAQISTQRLASAQQPRVAESISIRAKLGLGTEPCRLPLKPKNT